MLIEDAYIYVIASVEDFSAVDGNLAPRQRLAALLAASFEAGKLYAQVRARDLLMHREEIAKVLGGSMPSMSLRSRMPCGSSGRHKVPTDAEFCDRRHFPSPQEYVCGRRMVMMMKKTGRIRELEKL